MEATFTDKDHNQSYREVKILGEGFKEVLFESRNLKITRSGAFDQNPVC